MEQSQYNNQIKNSQFSDKIFLLGTFESRITIYSQQIRAINLIYSLHKIKALKEGESIGIVGGGVAGITTAYLLAVLGYKDITVYEKRKNLLAVWRKCQARLIHPSLFDWPNENWDNPQTNLPFLNWTCKNADEIAKDILKEFEVCKSHFSESIKVNTDQEIKVSEITQGTLSINDGEDIVKHDRLFIAVGYGLDGLKNDEETSYWANDNYSSDFSKIKHFVISGLGDGGIADYLTLRIKDFNFKEVEDWLKSEEVKDLTDQIVQIEKELNEKFISTHKKESQKEILSSWLYEKYKKIKTPELSNIITQRLRTDTKVTLHSRLVFPVEPYAFPLNRFLFTRLLFADSSRSVITSKHFSKSEVSDNTINIVFYNNNEGTPKDSIKVDQLIVRHGPKKAIEEDGLRWISESIEGKALIEKNTLNISWQERVFDNEEIQKLNPEYYNEIPRDSSAKVVTAGSNKNKLRLYPKPKHYFSGRDKELEVFKKAIEDGNNFIAIDGPGGIGKTQFVTKCIEEFIPEDKVLWFDCKPESHFDTLILSAGYPELLEGSSKTDRDKFSAFKDKIQDNNYFLFLDNFQETNTKPIFKEFLFFIQDYLKKGCVVIIDRDDIRSIKLTPKRIHIENLTEGRLEYAKALINHSYSDLVFITDTELIQLCDELQGYPLAIDFAMLLLSEGESHTDIISNIVNADGWEDISKRLLNEIFSRPDASQEERDFMMQFSVFNGSVPKQVVDVIITDEVLKVAPRKLKKKNLISFSQNEYEMHPLVKAFCYGKLIDKMGMHERVADYYTQTRKPEFNSILEEKIFYHLALSQQWELIERELEKYGRMFVLHGQLDFIKELIEKLRDQNIVKPIFNILSGDVAEVKGNWDEALEFYKLARNQGVNKVIKAEGLIKQAEILFRKGTVKEALPLFQKADEFTRNSDKLRKENARAVNDIGVVFKFFGDLGEALENYNKALKIRIEIEDQQGIASSYEYVGGIYRTQGDLEKALDYNLKSLEIDRNLGHKQGIASSYMHLGSIYHARGELKLALEYYQKSLEINEKIGNKIGIASSYLCLGSIYSNLGELNKALEYYQKSLEIDNEVGNKQGIASAYSMIGRICDSQGELVKALEHFQKSLRIEEEIGAMEGIASSCSSIGGIYHTLGELDKSSGFHQKSLEISKEIGNKQGIASSYGHIGGIYSSQGDFKKALEYHKRSLEIVDKIGNKHGIASSYKNIGSIYYTQGELKKALKFHQKSLELEKLIGNKEGIASSYGHIGGVYDGKGNLEKALEYYQKSLKIAIEVGDRKAIAYSYGNIGAVFSDKSDFKKALEYHQKSLEIADKMGDKHSVASSYGNIGAIYYTQGKLKKAIECNHKSLELYKRMGAKEGIGSSYGNIGIIYSNEGLRDYDLAIEHLLKSLSILSSIGSISLSETTKDGIKNLRSALGLIPFKKLVTKSYDGLNPELQKDIPLRELLNEPIQREKKVGRNDPCPCGSGKKYKQCHGK